MKYTEHNDVLEALKKDQDADTDNRERARDAHRFLDVEDGQWEPEYAEASRDKPRYQFDMTSALVDQICDDIEELDFSVKIKPSGGDATKEDAKLLDGMVRNIEQISNAHDTYELSGRNMVTSGFDAWLIKADYADPDSFDQDLLICPIANAVDSVWPGPFKKPDGSDMKHCFVLEAMPREAYDEKYPDRGGKSVADGSWADAFFYKRDQVILGQIYYLVDEPRKLLLMSDGRVLEDTEDNLKILDELAAQGITVSDTRNAPRKVCMTRLFDGEGWLGKPERTVFNQVPVILDIGNFKLFENKVLYRGAVQKLMDPQRVLNYAKSREIEEGALAPRDKYWMTEKQAEGHEATLATMNTNSDPVQFYNNDPAVPGPPQKGGGANINPGLANVSADMRDMIRDVGGLHAANLGDNPNNQSGIAIKRLQNKGDVGSHKYIKAHERAIARTGRIIVDAIPKVYDTRRQVRILKEDGSYDMAVLNDSVFDQQTQQWITLNDVSKGKYDVTCKAGPSYDNRQEETVNVMSELAAVVPESMQMGSDILLNNVSSPGMDLLAKRFRQSLFQQGMIPVEQMDDEERAQYEQMQQQPQEPSPEMVLAQAEAEKAVADREANQVKMAIDQRQVELKAMELQLKQGEQELKKLELQMKSRREEVEMETRAVENFKAMQELGLDADQSIAKTRLTLAQEGKVRKETALMGVKV